MSAQDNDWPRYVHDSHLVETKLDQNQPQGLIRESRELRGFAIHHSNCYQSRTNIELLHETPIVLSIYIFSRAAHLTKALIVKKILTNSWLIRLKFQFFFGNIMDYCW